MDRPLAGVRILDLTHVWAGPLGTRILGDMGAEVLKLEVASARGLRDMRISRGMYPGGDPKDEHWNRQGEFNKLNRNKKGLSIDLKSEIGRDVFLALVAESDVVIENFSASAMNKLGLGYETLRRVNESIIYVAMPGFGTTGPSSDFVAYGPSVEPMTGLTAMMGYSDEEKRNTAIGLPDPIAGVTAAASVVTALAQREQGNGGGHVDVPLHEGTINLLGEKYVETQLTGEAPKVTANRSRTYAPHGIYPCAGDDEWLVIACPDQSSWSSLVTFTGIDDAMFETNQARLSQQDRLDEIIAEFTSRHDKRELMTRLQNAGIPAGAVMTAPEFMSDPHVLARDYFVELGGEDIEPILYPGSPVRFDGIRASEWQRAPRLGEHNEAVLGDVLGLTDEEIGRLRDEGVIADMPPTIEEARR